MIYSDLKSRTFTISQDYVDCLGGFSDPQAIWLWPDGHLSRSMAGMVKIARYICDGSNFWVFLLLVQLTSY